VSLRVATLSGSRLSADADPGFVVELERFQGPLDLLLHLIRAQDIDIFDIPIARITEQFREAIEGVEQRVSLERAGEFLEMAATLVRIKAQMLLPRRPGEWFEEDPRSELVRRLLEYEQIRELARALGAAEAERAQHLPKGYVPPRPPPAPDAPPLECTLDEFVEVARRLPPPPRRTPHRPPQRIVTMEEKLVALRAALARVARLAFDAFVAPFRDRMHAVMSLLACLELAKQRACRLEQDRPFTTLWIVRREDEPDR
jgi:segregation and condensation protein A